MQPDRVVDLGVELVDEALKPVHLLSQVTIVSIYIQAVPRKVDPNLLVVSARDRPCDLQAEESKGVVHEGVAETMCRK